MSDTIDTIPGCDGSSCGGDAMISPADGIGRRTFIVQSALLAAAAALAACSGSGLSTAPALSSGGTPSTINVTSYPALNTVGGIAMVSLSGVQLAVVRTGTASFVALSRICPHQGGTVQRYGAGFECPIHGAQFSSTGQWTGGQRTSNLRSYTTSYDATTSTLTVS